MNGETCPKMEFTPSPCTPSFTIRHCRVLGKFFFNLKYLAQKCDQLRQARRPGGTSTMTVMQPYSICCLNGYMFRGDVNNMKMMSKNISCPLSLAFPYVCVRF